MNKRLMKRREIQLKRAKTNAITMPRRAHMILQCLLRHGSNASMAQIGLDINASVSAVSGAILYCQEKKWVEIHRDDDGYMVHRGITLTGSGHDQAVKGEV